VYRINATFKSSFPEKDLVISTLQKLGGSASVDEIYDLLEESISKNLITDILISQSQLMTVKKQMWNPRHLLSPVWEYIGPKQEFADLICY
jgi:hypothetical protein